MTKFDFEERVDENGNIYSINLKNGVKVPKRLDDCQLCEFVSKEELAAAKIKIMAEMSEDTAKGMIKYRLMDKSIVKRAIDTIAEFSDNVNATNNLYEFLDKDYFHEASEVGYILVDNYKNLKIREELRKCNYSGYILDKFENNYDNARVMEK